MASDEDVVFYSVWTLLPNSYSMKIRLIYEDKTKDS